MYLSFHELCFISYYISVHIHGCLSMVLICTKFFLQICISRELFILRRIKLEYNFAKHRIAWYIRFRSNLKALIPAKRAVISKISPKFTAKKFIYSMYQNFRPLHGVNLLASFRTQSRRSYRLTINF